jgi:hypothetical protein
MAATCAHSKCFCELDGQDQYCGTHCEEIAHAGATPTCECGHIACEEATMREGGVHTTGGPSDLTPE